MRWVSVAVAALVAAGTARAETPVWSYQACTPGQEAPCVLTLEQAVLDTCTGPDGPVEGALTWPYFTVTWRVADLPHDGSEQLFVDQALTMERFDEAYARFRTSLAPARAAAAAIGARKAAAGLEYVLRIPANLFLSDAPAAEMRALGFADGAEIAVRVPLRKRYGLLYSAFRDGRKPGALGDGMSGAEIDAVRLLAAHAGEIGLDPVDLPVHCPGLGLADVDLADFAGGWAISPPLSPGRLVDLEELGKTLGNGSCSLPALLETGGAPFASLTFFDGKGTVYEISAAFGGISAKAYAVSVQAGEMRGPDIGVGRIAAIEARAGAGFILRPVAPYYDPNVTSRKVMEPCDLGMSVEAAVEAIQPFLEGPPAPLPDRTWPPAED